MKTVAIVQSNYIPWKGYFDLISSADEMIIYDDMQYTRRDWRNRNKIKTPQGAKWLTVPVHSKGQYFQTIRETRIHGFDWSALHWKALELNYRRARFFSDILQWLRPLYLNRSYTNLSQMNRTFIVEICNYLEIGTLIKNSWDYELVEGKSERLANLCRQAGADHYISGPAAKGYINEKTFLEYGIKLSWFNYDGYPTYPQLLGRLCTWS